MFTITKESKRSQKMLTVLTVNQRVVGSSPTGGAKKPAILPVFLLPLTAINTTRDSYQ